MSWHCSQALVAEFSEGNFLGGKQSARLSSIRAAERSCFDARKMATCRRSLSGMTYAHSTAQRGVERWISSLRASRASRSVSPANGAENTTNATCGQTPYASSARWDRDTRCWRTFQVSFQHPAGEPYSANWPKRGMTAGGMLYPLPKRARRTSEKGSGFWPTPTVFGNYNRKGASKNSGDGLRTAVVMWPTPAARDWKSNNAGSATMSKNSRPLNEVVTNGGGGKLNPVWVEWLMGWPLGWTDLDPLETDRFQRWSEKHGNCLHNKGTSREEKTR